jgi:hypothetical protein
MKKRKKKKMNNQSSIGPDRSIIVSLVAGVDVNIYERRQQCATDNSDLHGRVFSS